MREEGRKSVEVRGLVIGRGSPKICVPLTAQGPDRQRRALDRLRENRSFYDLVELRADLCLARPDPGSIDQTGPDHADSVRADRMGRTRDLIARVRSATGGAPLLFTIRTKEEGGELTLPFEDYAAWNLEAAQSGADLIDLQLGLIEQAASGAGGRLLADLKKTGVKLVGSFHDFAGTPPAEVLIQKMVTMQRMGFDLTKVAVMPRDKADVCELLFASVQMGEDWADRPYLTMSMGDLGRVTRTCGTFSGSCMTFGTLGDASAPGQIEAGKLKAALSVL